MEAKRFSRNHQGRPVRPQLLHASSSRGSFRSPDIRRNNRQPSTSHSQFEEFSPGRTYRLITNAYSVQASELPPIVYEYKLIITVAGKPQDVSIKLLNRNFVSRSLRSLISDGLVSQIVSANTMRGSVIIDGSLDAIYTTQPFKAQDPESEMLKVDSSGNEFIFSNLLVKTNLLERLHVDITIRYAQTVSTSSIDQRHALLTAILHHEIFLRMIRYGSVYYEPHDIRMPIAQERGRLDLISDHLMGVSLSGLRRSVGDQTLVVIHSPYSYMTKDHRIIDLLASFIIGRPVDDVRLHHSDESAIVHVHGIESIFGSEDWFTSFCSILLGFKCKSEWPERNIMRFEPTKQSAASLILRGTTTVQEHYRQLGVYLNYPNLPCLRSKSTHYPYFPFELCSLVPDQKVPIFRLSTNARNHLNLLNKPKPELARRSSAKARDRVEEINKDQFRTFGLRISQVPAEAAGVALQKPTLQYNNQELEPRRDFWESGCFYNAVQLVGNWCVVNTVRLDTNQENNFFQYFAKYAVRFGLTIGNPFMVFKSKEDILGNERSIEQIVRECQRLTRGALRFIMFVIDSSSTSLNRLIHLSFDDSQNIATTCLRVESIMNMRQQNAIFRTLVHKLNARLGGTNVTYSNKTLERLNLKRDDLMIIGLDVTHPDNELTGMSIVGCAYTYCHDLFKHKSLVWPQMARVEIIGKMDKLMERILHEYYAENKKKLPKHIIVYRDGVSHEEFERVRAVEATKADSALVEFAKERKLAKPNLSYIIAQKRHTMRFFQEGRDGSISNPPSGTLINQDVISRSGKEFYLFSTTSPLATARPLHYHVLLNGLGIESLQSLTYFLCFNFGKCSGALSMPSSLRYAHNAAYDARNRVIAAREFSESKFYTSKFFC